MPRLDDKSKVFTAGFEILALRLRERYYTSVADFSRDLSRVFSRVLGGAENADDPPDADIEAIHSKLNEVPARTAEHNALSHEQKELKKLAKRIVKAVKEGLEAATRKEARLRGREMEEEIRRLDSMPIFASANAKVLDMEVDDEQDKSRPGSSASAIVHDTDMPDADDDADGPLSPGKPASTDFDVHLAGSNKQGKPTEPPSPPISRASCAPTTNGVSGHSHNHPGGGGGDLPSLLLHSPPDTAPAPGGGGSSAAAHHHDNDVFARGGVPWYLAPFDPLGTTIHEERYTGRAVLRDMSEELSDMDEDTLTGLAPLPGDAAAAAAEGAVGTNAEATAPLPPPLADDDDAPADDDEDELAQNPQGKTAATTTSTTTTPANTRSNRRRVGRRAQWSRSRK